MIKTYDQEQIEYFVNGYIQAALSTCRLDGDEEEYMDTNFSGSNIESEAFEGIKSDCIYFMEKAWDLMDDGDLEQMGMDFFFVRHGHGVGFIDRGIPETTCDGLTDLAHTFKETYWFVQDGKIGVD